MTADDVRTPKPERRWFQYRLRTLLVLGLLGALTFPWLARWINRPRDGAIRVELTPNGEVLFGGELVAPDRLQAALGREAKGLKRAGWTPFLVIEAHGSAKTGDVQALIEIAQRAGFDRFALRAAKYPMPEQ